MTARTGIAHLTVPNVGKAIAGDLNALGISHPLDLPGKAPYPLYAQLCELSGTRHDPCVIDVFIAAVRYMEDKPAQNWWAFTAKHKAYFNQSN